jgi:hypothetical protein
LNSEGFRETFLRNDREGPTKAEMAEKMAETNAGREERPETGSEEETSRDYSTGSEGTVGEVWIPIYNYSYRKFIYVSILKPRR